MLAISLPTVKLSNSAKIEPTATIINAFIRIRIPPIRDTMNPAVAFFTSLTSVKIFPLAFIGMDDLNLNSSIQMGYGDAFKGE